jgi:diguanylate cyclase (GGDEF)-like protein
MSSTSDTLRERLAALRQAYAEQLPKKVQTIAEACQGLIDGPWDWHALQTAHRMAHNLAGFGATFGFPTLGGAARTLEVYLQSLGEAGVVPGAEQRRQIGDFVHGLQRALGEPPTVMPTIVPATRPVRGAPAPVGPDNRSVYLAETNAQLADGLALQLGHFGYSLRCFGGLGELLQAVRHERPAAVIADVALLAQDFVATTALTDLTRHWDPPLPVMFLSAHGDLKVRLQAVRAGGCAFFTRPVDVGALIDKLDQVATQQATEPYRILIVEDDETLAECYTAILQRAGLVTETLTDPLAVMRPLVDFRPDLILMDVYMAGCTGLELAALIRQQEAYVSIPIVFLSAETNYDKQLAALRLGGDDFLTKPIEAEHLIASVSHRAHRSRILRSYMVRDSLTGLLNHSKTKEQLAVEVARARRQKVPLAFAMIDLDHFKAVNDKYGHQTGDRVLKGLARLLLQRLRKIDVVGRYGGEEFAVILPGTDAAGAMRVLDEIRASFGHVEQQAESNEFTVTFSCGISSFPEYGTAPALSKAADKALYRAKHAGRNRVVLAGPPGSTPLPSPVPTATDPARP